MRASCQTGSVELDCEAMVVVDWGARVRMRRKPGWVAMERYENWLLFAPDSGLVS